MYSSLVTMKVQSITRTGSMLAACTSVAKAATQGEPTLRKWECLLYRARNTNDAHPGCAALLRLVFRSCAWCCYLVVLLTAAQPFLAQCFSLEQVALCVVLCLCDLT